MQTFFYFLGLSPILSIKPPCGFQVGYVKLLDLEFLSTQNCCCETELSEPQRLQPVGSRGVPLPPSPAMHLALENMKYFPSFPLRTCLRLLSNITLTPAIK